MNYGPGLAIIILMAAIVTLFMINRPGYYPIVEVDEPIAEPVLVITEPDPPAQPQQVIFYDLGDGAIMLWSSDACPEPMVVNEFCFSPAAGKLYVGIGANRMPISTNSLVEYWEQYHR
jgi:hypothetical protein